MESRPGPAGTLRRYRPEEGLPARPDPPDLAQPGAARELARWGAGSWGRRDAGPAGEVAQRPSREIRLRPSQQKGRRRPSQGGGAGLAATRELARKPSRDTDPAGADRASAHAKERGHQPMPGLSQNRPSRDLANAGPARTRPKPAQPD
jgi:hypothetical protein